MAWDKVAVLAPRDGGTWVQTYTVRAVGQGQMLVPMRIPYPLRMTSLRYFAGTADGGGTPTAELRKNGIAGGNTVAGTSGTIAVSPSAVTGTFDFAAGDLVYIWQTAIGTGTIGNGLVLQWEGLKL